MEKNKDQLKKNEITQDLGSLGKVRIIEIEDQLVEVFAKYDGSPYPTGGAPYSDDAAVPAPYTY